MVSLRMYFEVRLDRILRWFGCIRNVVFFFFWSGEEVGEMRVQGYILNFWLECLKR